MSHGGATIAATNRTARWQAERFLRTDVFRSLESYYSLHALVTDLALAHKISWSDAQALIETHEAERAPDRLDMLLAGWSPPPELTPAEIDAALIASFKEWARQFWGTPREAALMIWYAASCKSGGRDPGQDPKGWWGGANAREAFCLDIDPERNPGDHTGLRMRSQIQLTEDLKTLRSLPDTRWKAERVKATAAELATRRRHQ